eukprot:1147309-Pelagomonas_calceolata.AAC.3
MQLHKSSSHAQRCSFIITASSIQFNDVWKAALMDRCNAISRISDPSTQGLVGKRFFHLPSKQTWAFKLDIVHCKAFMLLTNRQQARSRCKLPYSKSSYYNASR